MDKCSWAVVFTVQNVPHPIGVFSTWDEAESWITNNWRPEWNRGSLSRYIIGSPMLKDDIPPFQFYENGKRVSAVFPRGALIELDNPVTGGGIRTRLALVADSGTDFLDYIDYDQPASPLPILSALKPRQWGDCRALATQLLLGSDHACYEAYTALLLALCDTPAGGDPLTFNRAAKWAFESGNYDVEQACAAGMYDTAEARARQSMSELFNRLPFKTEGSFRIYGKP